MKSTILNTIFLITLVVIGCSPKSESNKTSTEQMQEQISDKPNQSQLESEIFVFEAYDTEGTLHQSTEYVGRQPVVLNFWGTWCPPCRREIPELVKLHDEFSPRGVEIVSLAIRNEPEDVISYADEHGMNWTMWMGSNDLSIRYNIQGVPTTIFIDSKGNELFRFIGAQNYETFKKAFEAIL